MDADAIRGRALVEESREAVVVLDESDRVAPREPARAPVDRRPARGRAVAVRTSSRASAASSRSSSRTRSAGGASASSTSRAKATSPPTRSSARGSRRRSRTSCGRRWPGCSPCSRRRALPGEDVAALVEQARGEVDQITELIDEVLFLSELESGARVVALGATPCDPVLEEASGSSRSARRGPGSRSARVRPRLELAIRPRMLRVVAQQPRRERDSLRRARARRSRSRWSATDGRVVARAAATTASGSTRRSCRGSSSASTAPIARGRRVGPVSGSRS